MVLVGHLVATDDAVEYHDHNLVSALLAIGVVVPYYFRRHEPLAVLLISEVCVVALAVGDYQTCAPPAVLLVGVYKVAARPGSAIGASAIEIGLTVAR